MGDMSAVEAGTPVINLTEIDGQFMASSREVADRFARRHADVLRAISELECSSDFIKRNFAFSTFSTEGSKRSYPYAEMTRDGFAFLVMGFTGKDAAVWKERYIDAFNVMAAQIAQTHHQIPQTYEEALLAHLNAVKENAALKIESDTKDALIHTIQPKADALDRLDTAEGNLTVRPASKVLGYPERKLIQWLQSNRWAFRSGGKGPLQAYVDKRNTGYLDHKLARYENKETGDWETSITLTITPKGLARLAKLLPEIHH